MLNKCIFVGRLGSNPELRYLPSGMAVCKFDIAVDSGKKDETEWVSIVSWDKQAESCAKYLVKGSMVAIDSRVHSHTYEKDGIRRKTTEFNANNVRFLDKPAEPKGDAYEPPASLGMSEAAAAFDDSCPF